MTEEVKSDREIGRIEEGKQRVSSLVDSASDTVSKIGDEASAKGEVAVVLITSRAAGTALAIKETIDTTVERATNTVEAIGDAIAWIIEHVEHLSIVDREENANYHRITAVGDASEFLRNHLDGLGLEEYDVRVEASIDSSQSSEDVLTVEIFRPTDAGEKPQMPEISTGTQD